MNSKRKNFIISNSILIGFIVILVLVANYYLVSIFGFNQETFIGITLFLIIFGITLNFYLSKPLLEPLFKSEENLQKTIKETLHELNIPASTIQANTQMLEKTINDEKSLKRLNRIKLATNELLHLYNQMEYEIKKEIDRVEKQDFILNEIINNSISKFQDIKGNIKIESKVNSILLNSDKNGFEKAKSLESHCKSTPLLLNLSKPSCPSTATTTS